MGIRRTLLWLACLGLAILAPAGPAVSGDNPWQVVPPNTAYGWRPAPSAPPTYGANGYGAPAGSEWRLQANRPGTQPGWPRPGQGMGAGVAAGQGHAARPSGIYPAPVGGQVNGYAGFAGQGRRPSGSGALRGELVPYSGTVEPGFGGRRGVTVYGRGYGEFAPLETNPQGRNSAAGVAGQFPRSGYVPAGPGAGSAGQNRTSMRSGDWRLPPASGRTDRRLWRQPYPATGPWGYPGPATGFTGPTTFGNPYGGAGLGGYGSPFGGYPFAPGGFGLW